VSAPGAEGQQRGREAQVITSSSVANLSLAAASEKHPFLASSHVIERVLGALPISQISQQFQGPTENAKSLGGLFWSVHGRLSSEHTAASLVAGRSQVALAAQDLSRRGSHL
jgi:hypothetical protein